MGSVHKIQVRGDPWAASARVYWASFKTGLSRMVATGEVFDTALDPIDDALVQKIRMAPRPEEGGTVNHGRGARHHYPC